MPPGDCSVAAQLIRHTAISGLFDLHHRLRFIANVPNPIGKFRSNAGKSLASRFADSMARSLMIRIGGILVL